MMMTGREARNAPSRSRSIGMATAGYLIMLFGGD